MKIFEKLKKNILKFFPPYKTWGGGGLKIVNLQGGLGNQMFEYAFAKAISNKMGIKILFDKTWFDIQDTSNKISPRRELLLDKIFNLKLDYATDTQIKIAKGKVIFRKFFRDIFKIRNKYSGEITINYSTRSNKRLYQKIKNKRYIGGYFQNSGYFEDIKELLINDFKFPTDKLNENNLELLKEIKECKNSVFIHIRRGDFLKYDKWALDNSYYQNAIKYIKDNVENPKFFILGEFECGFLENNFNMDTNYKVIKNQNNDPYFDWVDMYLMTQFAHGIASNSTFCFWGAYLNQNKDKIIVCPDVYPVNNTKVPCKNWVKIKTGLLTENTEVLTLRNTKISL